MVNLVVLRDLALAAVVAAVLVAAMTASTAIHPAAAQIAAQRTMRQACVTDVRTLCAGIESGGGRIKQCVVAKYDQLSDGCKDAMRQARALSTSN